MQKMKCISEDQYNRMLESYDSAMEELQDLKEQLHAVHSDPDRVAPVQQEGRGSSKIELKNITVMRVAPGELPSALCFQLNYIHHTELSQFVVMCDTKQQILYVNSAIPEEDIHKFVKCASWPEPGINDPNCHIAETVDYIYETYGWGTYRILMDVYQSRQHMITDARAKEKARAIIPLIRNEIRLSVEEDEPDLFDEELTYCISAAGNKEKYKNARNLVDYGTKYVFYLGYLMGAGRIKA